MLRGVSALGRLRRRLGDRVAAKHDAELRWWLEEWEPVIRDGGFHPGDALDLLDGEQPADDYAGRRWQQARAEVRRVLLEAGIADERFFEGKVVVDIGPGPLGFPDACPGRVCIGVDPLAERFHEHGLLIEGSRALYLGVGAERIPLTSGSVDVVLARNSLDHVDDPDAVLREAQRLLRPGGTLILNFDVGHAPTATEPHTLTVEGVRSALMEMTIASERRSPATHGVEGETVVLVANPERGAAAAAAVIAASTALTKSQATPARRASARSSALPSAGPLTWSCPSRVSSWTAWPKAKNRATTTSSTQPAIAIVRARATSGGSAPADTSSRAPTAAGGVESRKRKK
jgi:SAM-dependent methyltransferase